MISSMLYLLENSDFYTHLLLLLALSFVFIYEIINGFHDTANVVTTVIYTRAMQSKLAVVMAAIFNFSGVILGGLSVAYAILHILPINLLINISSVHGLSMIFSLLLAAIFWNFSTWYFGLPASSSHTLIGAIIGIGLTDSLLNGIPIINSLNFPKVINVFISLVVSPIFALIISKGIIFIIYSFWKNSNKKKSIYLTPKEYQERDNNKKPPFWIRVMLILSSIGVAFSHGANDGQKGIGLAMLVLIGFIPTGFSVNISASKYEIIQTRNAINRMEAYLQQHPSILTNIKNSKLITSSFSKDQIYYFSENNPSFDLKKIKDIFSDISRYSDLSSEKRIQTRYIILQISDLIDKLINLSNKKDYGNQDYLVLKEIKEDILNTIEYAPTWIIIIIAISLSIGTMIGWKRVTTTIGEKIGKRKMTYVQGISAQMTAAISIGIASYTGMPVSTTHILSSSIAGTMISNGGLQKKTIRNILITWICTIPASIILSGFLYWIFIKVI